MTNPIGKLNILKNNPLYKAVFQYAKTKQYNTQRTTQSSEMRSLGRKEKNVKEALN